MFGPSPPSGLAIVTKRPPLPRSRFVRRHAFYLHICKKTSHPFCGQASLAIAQPEQNRGNVDRAAVRPFSSVLPISMVISTPDFIDQSQRPHRQCPHCTSALSIFAASAPALRKSSAASSKYGNKTRLDQKNPGCRATVTRQFFQLVAQTPGSPPREFSPRGLLGNGLLPPSFHSA